MCPYMLKFKDLKLVFFKLKTQEFVFCADIELLWQKFVDVTLMCCVFSVISYGCETWSYLKAIIHKINAFEMCSYRRMLIISWTSHTTNIDVLQKIGVKETIMLNNLKNRKLSYAGHIMINTSGRYDTLLTTIEGRLEGKRGRGWPRHGSTI